MLVNGPSLKGISQTDVKNDIFPAPGWITKVYGMRYPTAVIPSERHAGIESQEKGTKIQPQSYTCANGQLLIKSAAPEHRPWASVVHPESPDVTRIDKQGALEHFINVEPVLDVTL